MAFTAIFRGTGAAEHVVLMRNVLKRLAQEAIQEPGTLRYDFYQPQDEPLVFLLVGEWESEDAWKTHLTAEAHTRYVNALPTGAWAVSPAMTRLVPL